MSGSEQERIADPRFFSLETREAAWNCGRVADLRKLSPESSPWKDESVAGKDWLDGYRGYSFGHWELTAVVA